MVLLAIDVTSVISQQHILFKATDIVMNITNKQ